MAEFAKFKKTPFLSKQTIKDHLGLLEGYKKNSEQLLKEIKKLDTDAANPNKSEFRTHMMQCRHNYNAELLHTLYFQQISDERTSVPKWFSAFIEETNKGAYNWTNFESWKDDFIGVAKAARGWAVLGFSVYENILANIGIDAHDEGMPPGFFPIVVLDVWEHAYIGDFGTNREKYINEWFKHIDWSAIEANVAKWKSMFMSEDLEQRVTATLKHKMVLLGHAREPHA